MGFTAPERAFVRGARVARLATADERGRPHVVPCCFALMDDRIVSPIDEKPKQAEPLTLRRVEHIQANPFVSLVVDRYLEDWDRLGWVRINGRAHIVDQHTEIHPRAVSTLRAKYEQYHDHALEMRPLVVIQPGSATSWGTLDTPPQD